MTPTPHPLPPSLAPRGLSRIEAAAYVGMSPNHFDAQVRAGRMPRPKRVPGAEDTRGRLIWDRLALDSAFAALPDDPTPSLAHAPAPEAGRSPEHAPDDVWSRAAV